MTIDELAKKVPDPWSTMGFAGNMEAELIIAQTIHGSNANMAEHGKMFSWKGTGLRKVSGGGLADNPKGLSLCFDRGWIEEVWVAQIGPPEDVERSSTGEPIGLVVTPRLMEDLESYWANKESSNE